MPKIADQPLRKITIHIYEADYQFLVDRYGAYQELLRLFIQQKCKELRGEE